jgi:hypothetical protein
MIINILRIDSSIFPYDTESTKHHAPINRPNLRVPVHEPIRNLFNENCYLSQKINTK